MAIQPRKAFGRQASDCNPHKSHPTGPFQTPEPQAGVMELDSEATATEKIVPQALNSGKSLLWERAEKGSAIYCTCVWH